MSEASLQNIKVRGSIHRRLRLSLMAGATVLTVGVYFMVLSVARQVAQESQDNILSASTIAILDSARFSNGQMLVDLPYSALSMLDSVSDERVFYAIRLENAFLSGYESLPAVRPNVSGDIGFLSEQFLGEEVRIATLERSLTTDDGRQVLQVSVAQTLTGQQRVIARIAKTSFALGVGVFTLLVIVASVIARSAIRPLDRLTESVSRRGPEDLRPVAAPVPSEMAPLVASLNRFMDRLKTSLSRSEDFIAEAAHRVRTPLTIVRTKAEIVGHTAQNADTKAAVDEMIHAIDESARTAEQLLDHAMVTFRLDHLSTTRLDLTELVQLAVDRAGPLFELRDVSHSTQFPTTAMVEVDPILVQNALQNLLDNALKYAPSGSHVELEVRVETDQAILQIRDNGPGFPENERDALADRFARGSNAESIVGSGLGLTIVQEVMEAHEGTLKIMNMQGGGACAQMSFPTS